MNVAQRLLALLGVIGLGTVATATHALAQDAQSADELVREAQLQCERALEENTIEALEEYLRKYPKAPTTCKVLALAALNEFSPDGPNGFDPSPDSGGYGG